MDGGAEQGVSTRERLELTAAALVPAAMSLLAAPVSEAARGAWLCPVLALPVGLWLCRAWRLLGDLPRGLERCFGRLGGKCLFLIYILWGVFLLAGSARRYADRLLLTVGEGGSRWLFLGVTLALVVWLGRWEAAFARTGRIFFLALAVTLGGVLLLAAPSLRWENLLPIGAAELSGVPAGALAVLSLAGYGVYGLCLRPGRPDGARPTVWAAWGCAALAGLLLAVLGAFGPGLALEMDEPFLYLLSGVGLPGAFRRGEAVLAAAAALGDLVLLTLLGRGCVQLWGELFPGGEKWGWLLVGAGFLLAGLAPDRETVLFWTETAAPMGNLILGMAVPTIGVLTGKFRRDEETGAHFVAGNP